MSNEIQDILPVTPIEGIEYDHKKRAKALREAQVRTSIRMVPGYSVVTDPTSMYLQLPNKTVKNPQDFRVKDMAQTLVAFRLIENAIGIAAPQIGWNVKCCAIAIMDKNDQPTDQTVVLFNPRIIGAASMEDDNLEWRTEGCLSLPGVTGEVCRIKSLKFIASTFQHPKEQTYAAHGLFARCLQHEIGHLKNRLFVEEQFVRGIKHTNV